MTLWSDLIINPQRTVLARLSRNNWIISSRRNSPHELDRVGPAWISRRHMAINGIALHHALDPRFNPFSRPAGLRASRARERYTTYRYRNATQYHGSELLHYPGSELQNRKYSSYLRYPSYHLSDVRSKNINTVAGIGYKLQRCYNKLGELETKSKSCARYNWIYFTS